MPSSNLHISAPSALNGAAQPEQINEYLIECFVRFVETIDKARQRVIEDHLKNYIKGRSIEKFYRQFYDEYDRVQIPALRVDQFVASLFE